MKNNVYKFPESLDQAWKRIDRKYEKITVEHQISVRKINWFAGGLLFGTCISTIAFSLCYYFFG